MLVIHQPRVYSAKLLERIALAVVIEHAAHFPVLDIKRDSSFGEAALIEHYIGRAEFVQILANHCERRLAGDSTKKDHVNFSLRAMPRQAHRATALRPAAGWASASIQQRSIGPRP